jgi:hypothetical protein
MSEGVLFGGIEGCSRCASRSPLSTLARTSRRLDAFDRRLLADRLNCPHSAVAKAPPPRAAVVAVCGEIRNDPRTLPPAPIVVTWLTGPFRASIRVNVSYLNQDREKCITFP